MGGREGEKKWRQGRGGTTPYWLGAAESWFHPCLHFFSPSLPPTKTGWNGLKLLPEIKKDSNYKWGKENLIYFNIHRDTVKVDFSPYICLYFARRHDTTGSWSNTHRVWVSCEDTGHVSKLCIKTLFISENLHSKFRSFLCIVIRNCNILHSQDATLGHFVRQNGSLRRCPSGFVPPTADLDPSTKLSQIVIHNFPEESDYNLRSCAY